MLKKLTISIYIFGGLVGLTIVIFIAVNSFDETLNPKITQLLNKPIPQQVKSENAYYPLLGLHSNNTITPYEAGLFLEKKHYELSDNYFDKPSIDINSFKEIGYTPFAKATKDICNVTSNKNCLDDYKKKKKEYEKSISSNKLLLSRYKDLLNYNFFYETQDDSVLRWSAGVFKAQRLHHAEIGLKWLYQDKKGALKSLNKDIQFWRMVMRSETGLIGKMVSIAMVEKDIQLLSQFISDCGDCSIYQNDFDKALSKLTENELSIRSSFEREFAHIDPTFLKVLENKKFTAGHVIAYEAYSLFYQVNSTRNKMFDFYNTVIGYSEDKNNSVFSMYRKVKEFEKEKDYGVLNVFNLFYNPVGKIFTAIAVPNSGKYVVAPYRIQALSDLVKIKQRILNEGMKKDQILVFLQQLPAEVTSTLFSHPPKYSQSDNGIYYDFIDDGRIFVKL